MKLIDLINRTDQPVPWSEGDQIPWNEPGFSERMLKEHLTQAHDAASRRFEQIDTHVSWIHHLLGGKPSRILDLGCGPGLYAQRLAKLGHAVTGIDFGPASVRYARENAAREGLHCTYIEADLREADFGAGFDLVMQIYGEINVFRPAQAEEILSKAYRALNDGGMILLDVEDFASVQRTGQRPRGWYSAPSGIFSKDPYLFLGENFWDEETHTTTERMYIIDAQSGEVQLVAMSRQAYSDEGYVQLLERCGFKEVQFFPTMGLDLHAPRGDIFPILARKIETSG